MPRGGGGHGGEFALQVGFEWTDAVLRSLASLCVELAPPSCRVENHETGPTQTYRCMAWNRSGAASLMISPTISDSGLPGIESFSVSDNSTFK